MCEVMGVRGTSVLWKWMNQERDDRKNPIANLIISGQGTGLPSDWEDLGGISHASTSGFESITLSWDYFFDYTKMFYI